MAPQSLLTTNTRMRPQLVWRFHRLPESLCRHHGGNSNQCERVDSRGICRASALVAVEARVNLHTESSKDNSRSAEDAPLSGQMCNCRGVSNSSAGIQASRETCPGKTRGRRHDARGSASQPAARTRHAKPDSHEQTLLHDRQLCHS